jgi:protein-tyrosine phosphatase
MSIAWLARRAGALCQVMFDLHSHILPGIDDGSRDLGTSIEMARMYVDDGVECVACTPHILPGLYHNTGPQIREAVRVLQMRLYDAGVGLRLFPGADNHVIPDFVEGLQRGHLLSLADTRYVLVEPPHHVAPARMDDLFFSLIIAGYVPILTHPERMGWIEAKYESVRRLVDRGVWMQVTVGALTGRFGRAPKYWAERMLAEGLVHILATDAHDPVQRFPDLSHGRDAAERSVGPVEAVHLVATRPAGILNNIDPLELPPPPGSSAGSDSTTTGRGRRARRQNGITGRLLRLFG